jgi:hypothetical protein
MANQEVAVRPAVGELHFHAFDRPIHPELIDTRLRRVFSRDGAALRFDVTASGHVLQWSKNGVAISEVLGDQAQLLPETRQLFGHRMGGERHEQHRPVEGVSYRVCFQVEKLPPELFLHLSDELRRDGERDGLLHLLSPQDRLGLSPVSFVDLQARPGSFLIHAYHTFPDEYAVVKTQTLIDFGR